MPARMLDFRTAASSQIESELCRELRQIRLSQNVTQVQLAGEAGVSPPTISRMERGQGVSLDTFIRVMIALGIQQNLQVLLPDSSVRPMERISQAGQERQRARPDRTGNGPAAWAWGDEEQHG
jgi:transcriptional regulator with XRE-family HTH domain